MFSLHDVPRALDMPLPRYTVWSSVRGSDGGTRCGDVVTTAVLPGARLALVVVDFIGRGTRRARRAGALGTHLVALLSLGVSAAAVRFADAELQVGGWEDDVPPLATVFAGIADASNHTLTYVSAAHDTALLLARDGTHRHLAFTGPVAGLFQTPVFAQADARFRPGDTLVVVTDGISDSHHAGGPSFGSAGTVRSATRALRFDDDPAEALVGDSLRHGSGGDDAAALIVRCNAPLFAIPPHTSLSREVMP